MDEAEGMTLRIVRAVIQSACEVLYAAAGVCERLCKELDEDVLDIPEIADCTLHGCHFVVLRR